MAQSHMRRAVSFDTTPLIWGVREYADSGQEHMVRATSRYIEHLSSQRYTIIVPSPVIAEYFVGADDTEIHEQMLLRRGFEYPYLDAKSAFLAAQLQRGGIIDQLHDESKISKRMLKIDALIIAISIVEGAEKIVTNNVKEFRTLARNEIEIDEVPLIKEQAEWDFAEKKRAEGDPPNAGKMTIQPPRPRALYLGPMGGLRDEEKEEPKD